MADIPRLVLDAVNNARTPGDVSAAISTLEWHTDDDACAILSRDIASAWWLPKKNWPDATAWSDAFEAAAIKAAGKEADTSALTEAFRDDPKDFELFLTCTRRIQDPLHGKQYLPADQAAIAEWQRRAELAEPRGGDWGPLYAAILQLPFIDFARDYFRDFLGEREKKPEAAAHLIGLIELGDLAGAIVYLHENLPARHGGGFGIPFFSFGGKKRETVELERARLEADVTARREKFIDENW
jgi:hypothetical protein